MESKTAVMFEVYTWLNNNIHKLFNVEYSDDIHLDSWEIEGNTLYVYLFDGKAHEFSAKDIDQAMLK
jgi:hypothetical protein